MQYVAKCMNTFRTTVLFKYFLEPFLCHAKPFSVSANCAERIGLEQLRMVMVSISACLHLFEELLFHSVV